MGDASESVTEGVCETTRAQHGGAFGAAERSSCCLDMITLIILRLSLLLVVDMEIMGPHTVYRSWSKYKTLLPTMT